MSAIEASVGWVQSLLFGPVATSFMVLAVASVGMRALTGYCSMRSAAAVVIGCFIMVGASQLGSAFTRSPSISSLEPEIIEVRELPSRTNVSREPIKAVRSDNPFSPYGDR